MEVRLGGKQEWLQSPTRASWTETTAHILSIEEIFTKRLFVLLGNKTLKYLGFDGEAKTLNGWSTLK